MATTTPTVRVIVRVPYNRPEQSLADPPWVEWNEHKERVLWDVIAAARAREGTVTDWKGLAEHLAVPLPYLLHRAQVRYESDLRRIQGLSAPAAAPTPAPTAPTPLDTPRSPTAPPRGVRARLISLSRTHTPSLSRTLERPAHAHSRTHSLSHSHVHPRAKKVSSSSTITLQPSAQPPRRPLPPLSPATGSDVDADGEHSPPSASEDSEDSADAAQHDAERRAQQDAALAEKLARLTRLMTPDELGLVAPAPTPQPPTTGRDVGTSVRSSARDIPTRGTARELPAQHEQLRRTRPLSVGSLSQHSLSSASVSSRGEREPPRRRTAGESHAAPHGESTTSSYSDWDSDASLSGLDEALQSNTPGSRLSSFTFARSQRRGR